MYDGTTFKTHEAGKTAAAMRSTDLDELIRQARAARAAAISKYVADAVGGAILWLRRKSEARKAERELMEMDSRLLNDIGVSRDEIKALIHGAPRVAAQARGEMLLDFIGKYVVEPFKRWEIRARTRDELMGLDDAMLRDIGIERGQIEGIALAVSEGKSTEREMRAAATLAAGPVNVTVPANTNFRRGGELADAAD